MTENMKSIILRHRKILLSDEVKTKHKLNEHEIISAATLPELDDAFTKKMHNFHTISELYAWSSSINYLNNINTPMIFINAKDDPIVPEALLKPIQEFSSEYNIAFYCCVLLFECEMCVFFLASKNSVLYLELAHGGHLGFYEGGLIYPNPVTWLDRALVALVGSLVLNHNEGVVKSSAA